MGPGDLGDAGHVHVHALRARAPGSTTQLSALTDPNLTPVQIARLFPRLLSLESLLNARSNTFDSSLDSLLDQIQHIRAETGAENSHHHTFFTLTAH